MLRSFERRLAALERANAGPPERPLCRSPLISAQISQSMPMTEIERIAAAIERCEAKLAAAADEPSRYYYRCCLIGWRAELARCERAG